jgi:hypothetical protein
MRHFRSLLDATASSTGTYKRQLVFVAENLLLSRIYFLYSMPIKFVPTAVYKVQSVFAIVAIVNTGLKI